MFGNAARLDEHELHLALRLGLVLHSLRHDVHFAGAQIHHAVAKDHDPLALFLALQPASGAVKLKCQMRDAGALEHGQRPSILADLYRAVAEPSLNHSQPM